MTYTLPLEEMLGRRTPKVQWEPHAQATALLDQPLTPSRLIVLRLPENRAARTQAPSSTNYDVHSPTWGDVRQAHTRSAMGAACLSHSPS
uniref:Uncharacterized protein n=1 Tax=Kalanchoe fedtschenkoi TaxID=63787 RepID=A0A7N0UCG4_KALFE